MLGLFILPFLCTAVSGEVGASDCCYEKKVGKVEYVLIEKGDTTGYNCTENCVYEDKQNPGSRFCFRAGEHPVTCLQEYECNCGKKKTSRIVGGTETEINEYPWMAAIANTAESFICGGAVIASEWILTATHCMYTDEEGTNPVLESQVRVVLGDHDITSTTESTIPMIVIEVSQIIKHPAYTASTNALYNDIALLKLATPVDLSVYTPVCLPKNGANFDGHKAWVYGWGRTSFEGISSDKLLEVEVPVVSNTVCAAANTQNTITEAMLCAGGELNKDGCQGDSGGPLTVDVDGKHFLIGDVSFGNGCGQQGQYGVYGDVAYFRTSFIDANIGDAKNCP